MSADPFEQLGLDRSASAEDVLAARRRLAKELHPDLGGDAARMRDVNVAVQQALAQLGSPAPRAAPPASPASPPARAATGRWRVAQDAPSFTVEALPAEAFEAIAVVTAWMGEALVDDPPYLLEAHLYDPFECWCRVELVPDAGASSVSLVVAVDGTDAPPDVDAVRDEYVANLNRLDWSDLHGATPPPP
jgi:hypothetical protein